jgi:virulence-associated protein VapD
MNCKYRHINSCYSCNFKCKNEYCKLHINNRNYVYEIIYNSIGIRPIKSSKEIFEIFTYIYENPILTKELIFKKLLSTIINKKMVLINLYSNEKFINMNMKNIIDEIYKINYNTYILIKNHKNKLDKLKTSIQRYLIRNHIYKDGIEITNDTDPFTFDNINDVKKNERFIYNDGSNNYFFKAIELKYFLETNGNWNPYTKKQINEDIIKNLDIFIKINNLIHKNKNDRYNWLSVNQAFTDVSQILERMGFYNNSEWFIKLSPKQIKNIIHLFNVMSSTNQTYFNNIDDNNIFYDFAKEIIRLFEDGNSNFLYCCIFMKAISVYSNDFYNSLPEWIADIETPLIIIDNSNLFYLMWNNTN